MFFVCFENRNWLKLCACVFALSTSKSNFRYVNLSVWKNQLKTMLDRCVAISMTSYRLKIDDKRDYVQCEKLRLCDVFDMFNRLTIRVCISSATGFYFLCVHWMQHRIHYAHHANMIFLFNSSCFSHSHSHSHIQSIPLSPTLTPFPRMVLFTFPFYFSFFASVSLFQTINSWNTLDSKRTNHSNRSNAGISYTIQV